MNNCDECHLNSENVTASGPKGTLIATINVKDLAVIRSRTSLLVVNKKDKAGIIELIALLKKQGYGRRSVVRELKKLLEDEHGGRSHAPNAASGPDSGTMDTQ